MLMCPRAARFGDAFDGLFGPNAYNSTYSYPWNDTDPPNAQQPCPYLTSTLQFGCSVCPYGTYNTAFGYSNGTAGASVNPVCRPCPFGGVCDGRSLPIPQPGYWGNIHSDGNVSFAVCPPGYCCADTSTCVTIGACFGNRTGDLCGDCAEGFVESIDSAGCIAIANL